jgi:hypothetical protein
MAESLPFHLIPPVITCFSERELRNFNNLILISFRPARVRARLNVVQTMPLALSLSHKMG